ncbi:MAG: F-box-like domain-containing protein [Bdellovibrionia bacterium]
MRIIQCSCSYLSILILSFSLAVPLDLNGAELIKGHRLADYFKNLFLNNRSSEENLLNTLPDELLASIFENLDLVSSLRVEQVDKRFHRIMQDRIVRNRIIDKQLKSVSQVIRLSVQDMIDLRDDYVLSHPYSPLREEKWTDFEISKAPVNQLLYVTLMAANPSKQRMRQDCKDSFIKIKVHGKKVTLCPELPVENISWDEIQTFLKRLNQIAVPGGYRYTLASRLQHNFANLGLVSHKRNPEDPKWKDFEDFVNGPREWDLEDDGRLHINANNINIFPGSLPGYIYSRGYFGLAYLLARASVDAALSVGQTPSVPYYPIGFRLVRFPISE